MKTFDQYLDEDRFELAATLLEQHNFPLVGLAEWYHTEGYCLSESELAQVMEGFWDEANTFWGDTWRGAAKGAGIGAGAGVGAGGVMGGLPGAGIGAGIGGLIGGAAGGLYGMGKNLWRRVMGEPKEPKTDYAPLLKKLAQDHPELGLNPDELISKLGKQHAPTQTQTQANPKPTWPNNMDLSGQPHKPASKPTPEDEEEWYNTVHGGAGGGK
jgi:hypothetical protein